MERVMKEKFIDALENEDINELRKIPKSDLHNHATRGGSIKFLERAYETVIPRLQRKLNGLQDMQNWYDANIKSICVGKLGYEKRLEAAFSQAVEDGITVLHMSFGYGESVLFGDVYEWINKIKAIHEKVARCISFIPEIGFARGIPLYQAINELEEVIDFNFFKSIDLMGDELVKPIRDYKKLYQLAKKNNMLLKAHVGEFGDALSVKETVIELELDQVQHGISAAFSNPVMSFLRENNTQLNICPSSNVLLSIIDNYKNHPIKTLYDNGVKVTINTDDMLIFNQSVSEEYLNLYRAGLFKAFELNEIRENGIVTEILV